jgi:HSP20 family protein
MSGRRDPFKEIEELFEQLNSGFAEMNESVGAEFGGDGIHVDVADTGEELVVAADVPGFDPDDIDVSVQDRRLSISAEHTESTAMDDEDAHYHRRERTQRSVTRTVSLPAEVDETAASASYENGVLTVELPKATDDDGVDIQVE